MERRLTEVDRRQGFSSPDLLVPVKIGILGYGVVGNAIARGFSITSQGQDQIIYHDNDYRKIHSKPLPEVIERSDLVFITLPTPMKEDITALSENSGIDLSIIEEAVENLTPYTNGTDKLVVIKSTVIPGTTAKFEKAYPRTNFAFNPEFLTEKNPLKDFLNASDTFIGANRDLTLRTLASFYEQRFPATNIELMSPTTAEAVKYFRNGFLDLKIAWANIYHEYCEALGISYPEVKKYGARDFRIGDYHLDVHEEDGSRGSDGKCLPKDKVALIRHMVALGVDPSFVLEQWTYNLKVNKKRKFQEIPFAVSNGKYGLSKTP